MHAMLDIETLGTEPGSMVLSAAIVLFNPRAGTVKESRLFVFRMDEQDRPIDSSTVRWWMNQPAAAAAHWLQAKPKPLQTELRAFWSFANRNNNGYWWAKSPSFDQIIMENLLRQHNIKIPWSFWKWRDVRTVEMFLRNKPATSSAIKHNPLDDCLAQVAMVNKFYEEQGLTYGEST